VPSRPRRILLVNPVPLYASGRAGAASRLQPGLVSMFSYLSAHGVPVDVLDLHVDLTPPQAAGAAGRTAAEALKMILARDFDLLAVSCNSSFHYLGAADLAAGVRAADPDVPIVVGGCHATAAPEDFTGQGSPFDVVVQGEGELELLELARTLDRRPSTPRVVAGRPLPLDRVFADFAGYPYWTERPHKLTFPLSRGCPFSCTFCAGAERDTWRAYRPREAVSLVRTMITLEPEVLSFSDACFGLNAAWRRTVLAGIAQLHPSQVIEFETRVEGVTDADADLLSGLDVLIGMGIETGSPRMAEIMRKAGDGEAYMSRSLQALAALGRRRVPTHVFLLVNHPGETTATLAETMGFAERLAADADLCAYATGHQVMLFPGTALAREAASWVERGVVFGHPHWWREREDQSSLADDIRGEVPRNEVAAAEHLLLEVRARAIAAMPASARMTWRRVRAPLRIPKERGGLGST
jgi:radical SAM superfamily enzyme YgiQ (UPF0313 family)